MRARGQIGWSERLWQQGRQGKGSGRGCDGRRRHISTGGTDVQCATCPAARRRRKRDGKGARPGEHSARRCRTTGHLEDAKFCRHASGGTHRHVPRVHRARRCTACDSNGLDHHRRRRSRSLSSASRQIESHSQRKDGCRPKCRRASDAPSVGGGCGQRRIVGGKKEGWGRRLRALSSDETSIYTSMHDR